MNRPEIRRLAASWVGAALLLGATSVQAEVLVLRNDSFEDGGEAAFQEGFIAGEMGAVTLGPVGETFQVQKVQFLFGPEGATTTVTVRIYTDTGAAAPGGELYSGDVQLEPSSSGMHELDLSGENVIHAGAGSIRVAIEHQVAAPPSIARDADGNTSARNWIYADDQQWHDSSIWPPAPFGPVPGDWIVRAEVETAGGGGSGTGGSGTGGSGTGGSGTGGSGTGGGSGATGPTVCIPGETQPCFGPGACAGGQSCLADGSGYGACECAPAESTPATAEEDGGCAIGGVARHARLPVMMLGGVGLLGLLGLARRRRRAR
jgi:hypothetical protein